MRPLSVAFYMQPPHSCQRRSPRQARPHPSGVVSALRRLGPSFDCRPAHHPDAGILHQQEAVRGPLRICPRADENLVAIKTQTKRLEQNKAVCLSSALKSEAGLAWRPRTGSGCCACSLGSPLVGAASCRCAVPHRGIFVGTHSPVSALSPGKRPSCSMLAGAPPQDQV